MVDLCTVLNIVNSSVKLSDTLCNYMVNKYLITLSENPEVACPQDMRPDYRFF